MLSEYRICNVSCDYYFSEKTPYSKLGKSGVELPVIRVFGINDQGEKCCAHIHGTSPCIWMRTSYQLSSSEKHQLSQTLTQQLQKSGSCMQTDPIIEISEVDARSMYGYYENKEYFLRISLRSPSHSRILTKILQEEAVHESTAQPYLSHIPFVLQFFIEYSIFGMGQIGFKTVHFRKPVKTSLTYQMSPVRPSSNMSVEFDAHVDDILNPIEETHCKYVNSGLEYIWHDEERRRGQLKMQQFKCSQTPVKSIFVTNTERSNLEKLKNNVLKAVSAGTDSNTLKFLNSAILDGNLSMELNFNGNNDEDDLDEESAESDSVHDELSEMSSVSSLSDDETRSSEIFRSLNTERDKFVGWGMPEFKPSRYGISKLYEQDLKNDAIKKAKNKKEVENPGASKRFSVSKEKKFKYYGNLRDVGHLIGDVTIRSRLRKHGGRSVSPIKGVPKMQSSSTVNNLCVMSIELIVDPVSKLRVPNPCSDPIIAVACAICTDICNWTNRKPFSYIGAIVVRGGLTYQPYCNVEYVDSEMELFERFSATVQRFDPDILVGYDLHRESWTYLSQRAGFSKFPLIQMISRVKDVSLFQKSDDSVFTGRIRLEVWKTVRRDCPMRCYEFGYVVGEVLDLPFMELGFDQFTELVSSKNSDSILILTELCLKKAQLNIRILEGLDIFVKTSQMARVYGIQFTEVLKRGSQYRVESMLLRLAKKRGMMPPAVGVKQRSLMGSPETIPLNLEPESGVYRDPVAVLDFQSLYPSICIAYNYCFTTCLGKMNRLLETELGRQIKLGAISYTSLAADRMSELLKNDDIHISPTGAAFVKSNVRKGLLAEMLLELIDTRVMVKDSVKNLHGNPVLRRTLNAQQMALKLVANVTYGYTAANWSGRMPCEEVADAIVSKGREALEKVIQMINNDTEKYHGARVIYGDTDSVFVLFEGCSRSEAFKFGRLIANDATKMNPTPMKLKFEKIMQPCILVTKKRYVGRSYEKEGDVGEFDAKGIETVRRDGSIFVSQMVEKCLNILFDYDHYAVVQYLQDKLACPESFPFSAFVINAEYRGNYSERAQVPAKKLGLYALLKLLMERKAICEKFEPISGERLPFLIVRPEPHSKTKLIDCVVGWEDFQKNPELQLHYNYYIGKQLMSALMRFFYLIPYELRYHSLHFDDCPGCGDNGNENEYCEECCVNSNIFKRRVVKTAIDKRQLAKAFRSCQNCVEMDMMLDFRYIKCFNYNCGTNGSRLKLTRSSYEPTTTSDKVPNYDRAFQFNNF